MNVTLGEVDPQTDSVVRVMIKSPAFATLIRSFRLQAEEQMAQAMDSIDPSRFIGGQHEIPAGSVKNVEEAMRLKITADELERLLAVDEITVYGSINIHL